MSNEYNEYKQQADNFLESTGTTFSIEFLYTGHHFPDDKEKRDIYQFTLKNDRGEYTAKFGDSIRNTERRAFGAQGLSRNVFSFQDKRALVAAGFKVRDVGYGLIVSQTELKKARAYKPSAYDILACLTKHDPGTFSDFCSDFGYSERPLGEYPKVQGIYQSVLDEYHAVRKLFGNHLDELAEIQ